MRVKICGITNLDDARAAAAAGADFAGLILAHSIRRVRPDQAPQIAGALPATTQAVLVFRDAPPAEMLAAVRATGARWVQFHGREPVANLAELSAHDRELHFIRAWEVRAPSDGDALRAYLQAADAAGVLIEVVLLDVPKTGHHPGFDCLATVAAGLPRPPQVWCAGGLSADNVAEVARTGQFDGVDVASGVETRPGLKDHVAVRRFVAAAKRVST